MSGIPPLPPLRIKEADGSPNVIPVFQITLSNGLTLYNDGGGKVTLDGSGSQGPAGPAGTVTIGSGITGGATPGNALIVGPGSVLAQVDTGEFIRAYAATDNKYVVLDLASDLTNEFRFVQSGNSITVTTASGLITINAVTGNLATKQDLISIPLIVTSGGTGLQTAGSGTMLVGMNSSGVTYDYYLLIASNNATVTRSGTAYYISATTNPGGGAGSVSSGLVGRIAFYPQTGTNVDDLTMGSAHTILGVNSSEASYTHYLLLASNNATVTKVGTAIYISADTGTGSGSGGGASTANTYVVTDFTSDLSNEFRLVQSGNSVTINTANNLIVINAITNTAVTYAPTGGNYVAFLADASLTNEKVLTAGTNVTISTDSTAIYINADTGGGGGAPTNAEYVTYAGNGSLSNEKILTAGSSVTIVTDATAIYINAITNPAGAGGTQTIRIPMAVLTVKVSSANAFYVAKSGSQLDEAHMTFVDSGVGVATYWCEVPYNINATENWNLVMRHEPDSGAGGNVAMTFCAKAVSDGSYMDSNTVVLLSARSFATYSADTLSLVQVATGVIDNTLGLAQNQLLYVIVQRLGNNAGDTVNANWNLKSLSLQCDVNS